MLVRQFDFRRAVSDIASRYGFHELVLAHFKILEYCLAVCVGDKGFRAVLGGDAITALNELGLNDLAIAVLQGERDARHRRTRIGVHLQNFERDGGIGKLNIARDLAVCVYRKGV